MYYLYRPILTHALAYQCLFVRVRQYVYGTVREQLMYIPTLLAVLFLVNWDLITTEFYLAVICPVI